MPFKPGDRHPGAGRPKGSKNKKRVLRVEETLVAKGLNPIEEIIRLIPELKKEEQVEAWQKLVPYYQAPIKVNEPGDEDEEWEDLPEAALIQLAKGSA